MNLGIKELEKIYDKEQAILALKERGQIVPDSALPAVSFDEKFAQIIDEYCSGDENLKKQLLAQISGGISSKSELSEKKNFLAALNTLKSSTNQAYEQKLAGKSFETYQKEYQNAYKSALGGSNPVEITERWVQNQKQGAAGVKMAAVIASTAALGGSSLISASTTKLAQTVGTNSAANIVKLGMTAFGTAESTALDYANAFSSESGLTTAKNAEILASAKNALPYAFFGAYVSGPMGSKIANALKGSGTAPKILEKAFSAGAKTAGFTTEISTDALFELAISDNDFLSAIEGCAAGEMQGRLINKAGSMLAGGRANAAAKAALKNAGLENTKIRKTPDNKYELVASDGKIYTADSAESLLGGIFAKINKATGGYLAPVEENGLVYRKGVFGGAKNIKPASGKADVNNVSAKIDLILGKNPENKDLIGKLKEKLTPDTAEFLNSALDALNSKKCKSEDITTALYYINAQNKDFATELVKNKNILPHLWDSVLQGANNKTIPEIKTLLSDKNFVKNPSNVCNLSCVNEHNIDLFKKYWNDERFKENFNPLSDILYAVNSSNADIADKILTTTPDLLKNAHIATPLLREITPQNKDIAQAFIPEDVSSLSFSERTALKRILMNTNNKTKDFLNSVVNDKKFSLTDVSKMLHIYNYDSNAPYRIENVLATLKHIDDLSPDARKCLTDNGVDLQELKLSLNHAQTPISVEKPLKNEFFKKIITNNNEKGLLSADFSQYRASGIPLKYSKQAFLADVKDITSGLSENEKKLVFSHFGLKETPDGLSGTPNLHNFENDYASERTKAAAQKLKAAIENFTVKNEANIQNPEVKGLVDSLLGGFPEFSALSLRKSADGTDFGVKKLESLQNLMKSPEYAGMSDGNKTILKMSLLLDGEKPVDALLERYNLSDSHKFRIKNILENKNVLKNFAHGGAKLADVVAYFRNSDDYKTAKLLLESGYDGKSQISDSMDAQVSAAFKELDKGQKFIFSSRIVDKSKKFPTKTVYGKEVEVLDFSELPKDADLSVYGFPKGTTKDNITLVVHMTARAYGTSATEDIRRMLRLTKDTNIAPSASLFRGGHNSMSQYGDVGVVLENDNMNIATAAFDNATGTQKDTTDFKRLLLANESNEKFRTLFLSNLAKNGYEISADEYGQLAKQLQTKKHIDQIKDMRVADKLIKADALKNAYSTTMDDITGGEIVTFDPTISMLYTKYSRIEDCPREFIEIAHENGFRIILQPEKE